MNIHTLSTGIANTYIVDNRNGVVVIDAGIPHQARRIVGKIRALGYAPRDTRLIVITHGHVDHAGSAVALQRLTGAPLALHRADARLVATPNLKIPPARNRAMDALGRLMTHFGWMMPLETFTPDVWLDDGQSLCEFGIDARVVHTPGHTAGSLSVALENGVLFVGDALLNLLHVAFPLWWEDAAAARESAHKIQALRPRIVYSGHGRAFDARALEAFAQRLGGASKFWMVV